MTPLLSNLVYFFVFRHSLENHQANVITIMILITIPRIKNADKPRESSINIFFLSVELCVNGGLCLECSVLLTESFSRIRVSLFVESE